MLRLNVRSMRKKAEAITRASKPDDEKTCSPASRKTVVSRANPSNVTTTAMLNRIKPQCQGDQRCKMASNCSRMGKLYIEVPFSSVGVKPAVVRNSKHPRNNLIPAVLGFGPKCAMKHGILPLFRQWISFSYRARLHSFSLCLGEDSLHAFPCVSHAREAP